MRLPPTRFFRLILFTASLIFVLNNWAGFGFDFLELDTDLGRDLKAMSDIKRGDFVWLGPWLGPGLHASSTYYYLFYPSLWLSQWKPEGMIWMSIGFALIGIVGIALPLIFHQAWLTTSMVLIAGLTPWMQSVSTHPGNGFTYALFTWLTLLGIWRAWPLWLVGGFYGFATAMHPGALIVAPLFIQRMYTKRKYIFTLISALLAFLLPWSTLIGFEVITKGFIIRRFLEKPSSGIVQMGLSFDNLGAVARLLGMPWYVFVLSLVMLLRSSKVHSLFFYWLFSLLGMVVLISLVNGLPERYLFAVSATATFLFLIGLRKMPYGPWLAAAYAGWLLIHSPLIVPRPASQRPISAVVQTVDKIEQLAVLSNNQAVGVVAALWKNPLVPQADDYRYLLRVRGYDVVDITQHDKADTLLLIIEEPAFDWRGWSNWEINSFGNKQLDRIATAGATTIVSYQKVR